MKKKYLIEGRLEGYKEGKRLVSILKSRNIWLLMNLKRPMWISVLILLKNIRIQMNLEIFSLPSFNL